MALNKSALQSDFEDVFSDMLEAENATDEYFAKGISEALVSYISGGKVATIDAGTVLAGTYSGSGSGKLTVESGCDEEDSSDWTGCAKKILDACKYMLEHAKDEGFNGSDYLVSELKATFNSMWSSREDEDFDGNAEFAKTFAKEVDTLYKAGIISTDGQEDLSGASGAGNIS